uniref:Uncharacterized protein n=1 Tax=Manihot esculenta TaxID=3983 RepID=A0A2C9U624_MANES
MRDHQLMVVNCYRSVERSTLFPNRVYILSFCLLIEMIFGLVGAACGVNVAYTIIKSLYLKHSHSGFQLNNYKF